MERGAHIYLRNGQTSSYGPSWSVRGQSLSIAPLPFPSRELYFLRGEWIDVKIVSVFGLACRPLITWPTLKVKGGRAWPSSPPSYLSSHQMQREWIRNYYYDHHAIRRGQTSVIGDSGPGMGGRRDNYDNTRGRPSWRESKRKEIHESLAPGQRR